MAGIGFGGFNNPYLPKATTLKANTNAPLAKATLNNQPTGQTSKVTLNGTSGLQKEIGNLTVQGKTGNFNYTLRTADGKLIKITITIKDTPNGGKFVDVKTEDGKSLTWW